MEAYLNGSLDDAAMHQVEKLLLDSPFEAEAMEGLSSLSKSERAEDLAALRKDLTDRRKRYSTFRWWYVAAAIALISLVSIFVFRPQSTLPEPPVLAQEESAKKNVQVPDTAESNVAEEPSDLIALNQSKRETVQKPKPVEDKEQGETDQQQLRSAQSDQPMTDDIEVIIPQDTAPEEAEGLEADPEISIEPSQVPMKTPSVDRSKVGRIAGEPLPVSDESGRRVRGRIIMQDGTPLPGVNVAIRGTDKGTNSNVEGYYEIDVPKDATLVFSMLGLEEQTIAEPRENELNVTMKQGDVLLSEQLITSFTQTDSVNVIGASPISGEESYNLYLKENQRYPPSDQEGTVVIRITVGPDGNISNMEVTRSIGPMFDSEAMRLIREGPIWLPALENGEPVTDHVLIEVEFKKE
jgi:TonB family protein